MWRGWAQVRWGTKGQWVSFKTTRDVTLPALKKKFADALHVAVEELLAMDLQWRDESKSWWRVLSEEDVEDVLAPPGVQTQDAASGQLTEYRRRAIY